MRKVQEQVEDPNQDLNLEQFNELLSQLQQARENGVQILSYQEYVNDRNDRMQSSQRSRKNIRIS